MVRLKRTSALDRRSYSRLDLQLKVYGTGEDGMRVLVGTTLNISRCGALVVWDSPLQANLGKTLKLAIEVPSDGGPQRILSCRSKVMRVEEKPAGGPRHVAISILHMRFGTVPKIFAGIERIGPRKQRASRPAPQIAMLAQWVFFFLLAIVNFAPAVLTACAARPGAHQASLGRDAAGVARPEAETIRGGLRHVARVSTGTVGTWGGNAPRSLGGHKWT